MRYETYRGGDSAVEDVIDTASAMGYDGLIWMRSPEETTPATEDHPTDRLDLVDAIELDPADPQEASGLIGTYRSACELLVVRGGTPKLNRFIAEQERVDVLAAPMADDGDLNHVITATAAENGVRIELSLRPVIQTRGGRRVRAIQDLRKTSELLAATDCQWTVTAGPERRTEFRDWRSIVAIGATVGLGEDMTQAGIEQWYAIITRNRQGRADWFVEPGVYRGKYEDRPE